MPAMDRWRIYGFLIALSVITAGAGIVFLYHSAKVDDSPISHSYPALTSMDAYQYGDLAKNMVNHHVFSFSKEEPYILEEFRTPGYPAFIAPFYALFKSLYPVLIAQIVLVAFTAILIFKMGEKIAGTRWGLVAAALYAVVPDTALSAGLIMSETLFLFLFIGTLYVLFFSDIENLYLRWGLTGLLLAVAAYVRPAGLYLPFVIIAAYFIFSRGFIKPSTQSVLGALLCVVVFFGALGPWYVRNHAISGVWGFSSLSSYNIFYHYVPLFLSAVHGGNLDDIRQQMRVKANIPPDYSAVFDLKYSAAENKVSESEILADPLHYAKFHLSFLPSFFFSSGLQDWQNALDSMQPDFKAAPEPSLGKALNPFSLPLVIVVIKNHGWYLVENIFWAVIVLLSFAGLWRSKNRRVAGVFMILILYFAITAGPAAHARIRIPAMPLLLLGAVSTAAYVVEKKYILRKTV